MRDLLQKHISSKLLFLAGLLIIPAFLLQSSLAVRAAEVALFMLLCGLTGKTLRPGLSLVIIVTAAVFHVLSPVGRVLFQIGQFPVTAGSLERGALRGLTVVGLFYLSRFVVRDDLRFPGKFGDLIGRSLRIYRILLEERTLDPRKPIRSLDRILLRTYSRSMTKEAATAGLSTFWGVVFLLLLTAGFWFLTALSLSGRLFT